jgi:hypothetical protein
MVSNREMSYKRDGEYSDIVLRDGYCSEYSDIVGGGKMYVEEICHMKETLFRHVNLVSREGGGICLLYGHIIEYYFVTQNLIAFI